MTKRRGPKRIGKKSPCTHPQTRRLGNKPPHTWKCLTCPATWKGK